MTNPPPTDLPFGVWLAAQRHARGLTQAELAPKIACSKRLVEDLEQGRRRLSAGHAAALLRFFKVPPAEWLAYRAWARGTGPRPASAVLPAEARTQPLPPLDQTPAEPPTARLSPRRAMPRRPPTPRFCPLSLSATPDAAPPSPAQLDVRWQVRAEWLEMIRFDALTRLAHWRMRSWILLLVIFCLLASRWPGPATFALIAVGFPLGLRALLPPWLRFQEECGTPRRLALTRIAAVSFLFWVDVVITLPAYLPH
jgi:transcriptional regulator with XRE-family HTH domain